MPTTDVEFRESRFPSGFVCPSCESKRVVRYGRERTGIQRYYCNDCRRTFNDRSVTPMARTKKPEKWESFAHCMREGLSCRKAAKFVDVHYQTTFAWRHKVLRTLAQTREVTPSGIVEADEMSFRRLYKGSKPVGRASHKRGGRDRNGRPRGQGKDKVFVLVARDREGQTASLVLDVVTRESLAERLVPVVRPSAFCTGGSAALRAVAKEQRWEHREFLSTGAKKRGIYHIQNVNSYHARFREWLVPFHGVSTRYLSRYANWHVFAEDAKLWPDRRVKDVLFANAPTMAALQPGACPLCGTPLRGDARVPV